MKLLVLCVSASVAVVSALNAQDASNAMMNMDTEPCVPWPWLAVGSTCDLGYAGTGLGWANCTQDDNDAYQPTGVCCSEKENVFNPVCIEAYAEGCITKNLCGMCIFKEKGVPTPPSPACPCATSCCEDRYPLIYTDLLEDGGYFYGLGGVNASQSINELFQPRFSFVGDLNRTHINRDIRVCGEFNQTIGIEDEVFEEFTCLDLCCEECCDNLDVSFAQHPANLDTDEFFENDCNGVPQPTGSVVLNYAENVKRFNYAGPALLCASNSSIIVVSHTMNLIFANGKTYPNGRVDIGCTVKQGGGNNGFERFNKTKPSPQ